MHNGPRMARLATMPVTPSRPSLNTTSIHDMPERSVSVPPSATRSPTTPRASHLSLNTDSAPHLPLPVSPGLMSSAYESTDDDLLPPPSRGRYADSCPPTPSTARSGPPRRREHSADSSTVAPSERTERERRPSHTSVNSAASSVTRARPSTRDFILGEELGRGSYSTVVHAVYSPSFLANNPRPANSQFAIKIMNQAHLIQEKKAKYAHIERDALIRLAQPNRNLAVRGHHRGLSSSSGHSGVLRKTTAGASGPTVGTSLAPIGGGEVTSSALVSPTPLSPRMSTSRRLRGDGQEVLDERPPPSGWSSRPPSPVQEEEDGSSDMSESLSSSGGRETAPEISGGSAAERARTPRKRRQSLAPSERSARSGKSTAGSAVLQHGHPGIVRLYSTFADRTSVCESHIPFVRLSLADRRLRPRVRQQWRAGAEDTQAWFLGRPLGAVLCRFTHRHARVHPRTRHHPPRPEA